MKMYNNKKIVEKAYYIPFPAEFSKSAKLAIDYFEGCAYLFYYNKKFVVLDESLDYEWMRFEADTLDEIETWFKGISVELIQSNLS